MRYLILLCLIGWSGIGGAEPCINVVGLFSGKAVLVINGSAPHMLAVGQVSPEGVKLLAADSVQAVLEVDGKRKLMGMGQGAATVTLALPHMTLYVNKEGHFFGEGKINGHPVRFLLDTGATVVTMSSAEARRLGIDYPKGSEGESSTAGGTVRAWSVVLDSVRLGGITLNQVEGVVIDGDSLPFVLLGMSALTRMEAKRNGVSMTLIKKY
jgi:aspartyl protease family protein